MECCHAETLETRTSGKRLGPYRVLFCYLPEYGDLDAPSIDSRDCAQVSYFVEELVIIAMPIRFVCMFGHGLLDGGPTPKREKWYTGLMLVAITFTSSLLQCTTHNCTSDSPGTVVLGELAVMITLIRNRMRQTSARYVAVFPVKLCCYPRVALSDIANRKTISIQIWMLSFVGPQHGRIIHPRLSPWSEPYPAGFAAA